MSVDARRDVAWRVAKVAITVALFYLIARNVDWARLEREIVDVEPWLTALCFGAILAMIPVSAWKWAILARPLVGVFPLPWAVHVYFVGFFFNNFLPSSIGGDGYRGFKAYQRVRDKTLAALPIVVERVSGLLVLALVGAIASITGVLRHQQPFSAVGVLLGVGLVAAILIAVALAFRIERLLRVAAIAKRERLRGLLEKLGRCVGGYRQRRDVVLAAAGVTILFYALQFAGRYALVRAVGADIAIDDLITVVMLSSLIAMLPISINGYGLLDLSFVTLLAGYGVGYEDAVLVMFVHRCLLLLASAIGGLLYLRSNDDASALARQQVPPAA